MSRRQPKFIKANGKLQRSDVSLTREVASTLVHMILQGQTIFPQEGYLDIIGESGQTQKLLTTTINKWITRENIIPETGRTLREVLNQARADYRTKLRGEKQELMLEQAETKLNRSLALRTTVPIRDMFGKLVYNADGKVARRESVGMLRAQIEAAKYVTERLDPKRYGRVDKTENKHLIFNLADLRRYKDEKDKAGAQP